MQRQCWHHGTDWDRWLRQKSCDVFLEGNTEVGLGSTPGTCSKLYWKGGHKRLSLGEKWGSRGAGWTAQTPSLCLASLCLSLNWPPTTWGGSLLGVLSNIIATGFPASTWFSRKKDKRNCSAFSSGTVLGWCWVMLQWQIKLKFSMAWHDENVLLTHFPWQPLSLQWLWGLGCFHARAGPSVSSNFQMTVRGEMRNGGNSLALNCAVSDNHHFYFKFFAQLHSCGSQPNARRWGVVGEPTNIWRILTISVPKDLIQPHFQEHPLWLFWSKRKGALQHKNWVCLR